MSPLASGYAQVKRWFKQRGYGVIRGCAIPNLQKRAPTDEPDHSMSLASVLLAPLALLFPGLAGPQDEPAPAPAEFIHIEPAGPMGMETGRAASWQAMADAFRVQAQNQVRIEQRMTVRISPRTPLPPQASFLMDLPDREIGPQFIERKIGKCLPIAGIAGVQVAGAGKLVLFMRDRRMVSASLERACRARDFYSGFYLERSADGRLCVDRDTLLSRSGANCKLTRFRQLVEADD